MFVLADINVNTALVGVLLGAGAALLGQVIAHRYAQRREDRRETTAALDRVVSGIVSLDRRVSGFLAAVGTEKKQPEVQAAADLVTDAEERLRAALFALQIRLPPENLIMQALRAVEEAYTHAYLAVEPLISAGDRSVLDDAFAFYAHAREGRDVALDLIQSEFRKLR